MKLTKASALALTLCTAGFARSHAALIVVAPTATTPGSFEITQDITFLITTAGSGLGFVLDEWVVSDGSQEGSSFSPGMLITRNPGSPATFTGFIADNAALTSADITPNDGFFSLSNFIPVSPGNLITIKAGVFSINPRANFNPQTTQTFVGDMFMIANGGARLSASVKAPEPTAFALVGLGSLVFSRRRRRTAA